MLTKDKKLEITERIIQSDTFKKAPTSIAILKYLVNAEIEERFLKEGIIDIEFFGAKGDSNKSNPRVRVNIYNLRKKLHKYYETEGTNDTWQIIIDKGQYGVRFEKQGLAQKQISRRQLKMLLPYSIALLAILLLVFSQIPKTKPELWKGFFNNGHNTNLFIGDAFGYGGKTLSGNLGWTRDYSVNNLDDYYEMLEEIPHLKNITSPSEFTYSTRMAENATHDLSRFFTQWNSDFEIKYATETSFSDIKKENTIYIGRLKDQTNFIYLFNEANPYFKINERSIEFSGHPSIPDTTIATNTDYKKSDYALVSRIPGPNQSEQFLFFSDHDIGVMATVEYFTNKDSIKAFTQRHLNDSPYFTAIYKAKGKDRINLNLETVLVVPLK